jgi:uncharacterized protein
MTITAITANINDDRPEVVLANLCDMLPSGAGVCILSRQGSIHTASPEQGSNTDMTKVLPHFKYHPDPVGNGLVTGSDKICACCSQARGFIYRGPVYSVHDLGESICPWCIADGTAAAKFGATFTDEDQFLNAGLDAAIVETIAQRTPGYIGWQQETWLTHCDDACAYLGFPTDDELNTTLAAAVKTMKDELAVPEKQWLIMRKAYVAGGFQPQGRVGLYKLQCLHCGTNLLSCDSN